MDGNLLMGIGRFMVPIPQFVWRRHGGERGLYMTIAQSVYVTRVVQSTLFGF